MSALVRLLENTFEINWAWNFENIAEKFKKFGWDVCSENIIRRVDPFEFYDSSALEEEYIKQFVYREAVEYFNFYYITSIVYDAPNEITIYSDEKCDKLHQNLTERGLKVTWIS